MPQYWKCYTSANLRFSNRPAIVQITSWRLKARHNVQIFEFDEFRNYYPSRITKIMKVSHAVGKAVIYLNLALLKQCHGVVQG